MRTSRLSPLITLVALIAYVGLAGGTTTGKNGYDATRQIDTLDAQSVTVFETRNFNANASPLMAVDSAGTVYVVAATVDGPYLHQEVLSFTPSATGGSGLTRVFGVRAYDTFVRALMVVPADTAVLVKDQLLVLVDGWDSVDEVSFRELWLVDPSAPSTPTVLYHKSPEPTSYMGSVGGSLSVTVALDGDVYLQQEFDQNVEHPGSIRALRYDSGAGAYAEDATPVTTDYQTTGQVLAGPDGYLYGFERITPSTDTPFTDHILRIDPDGTDSWTSYATFTKKFGDRHPSSVALAFDSSGELFFMGAKSYKGGTLWFVEPVAQGGSVSGSNRIAESSNSLRKHQLAAGPAEQLYVIEREVDNPSGTPDLDAIYELSPGSGGGGAAAVAAAAATARATARASSHHRLPGGDPCDASAGV